MERVDLRSDTLTRPTEAMRRVIAEAVVGDDVFGEDPSINGLQEEVAERFGKEAALFVPSGTMANQITLLVYCRPGDHVLVPAGAHVIHYEAGGAGAIAGVQLSEVPLGFGAQDLAVIADAIQPDNHLQAPTRLVTVEHTHNRGGGRIIPWSHIEGLRALTRERELAFHLDGARLFNALVATGRTPAEVGAQVDSLSICLSKGLGAPVGSVLVGSEAFIERAHRYRKMLGGGMRQGGLLAAAGRHALAHHVERLAEDHARARALAEGLSAMEGAEIEVETVESNIVIFAISEGGGRPDAATFVKQSAERGLACYPVGPRKVRWVTHMHITDGDVERALEMTEALLNAGGEG